MIHITPAAQDEFKRIMGQEGKGSNGIRLGVKGGGCSGFTYVMDFVQDPRDNDTIFNQEETPIYVDDRSMTYLDELEIDFLSDLLNRGFKFNNPNASQACGCGTSFAV